MEHKQKEVGNLSKGRGALSNLPLPSALLADIRLIAALGATMLDYPKKGNILGSQWVTRGGVATSAMVCQCMACYMRKKDTSAAFKPFYFMSLQEMSNVYHI